MKKIISVFLLFCFGWSFSQFQSNENTFDDEVKTEVQSDEDEGPGGPGNPPGVPINNYLPVLVLTALGIIIVTKYRKQGEKL